MKTAFNIRVAGPRPYFRLVVSFLWSDLHNVDSDGDSTNPASTEWTELYRQYSTDNAPIEASVGETSILRSTPGERNVVRERMIMSDHEQILAKVGTLKSRLIAIEAYWEGDSTGWYVLLSGVTNDWQSHFLGGFSNGGDFKLFTGEVPPWPGAIAAQQLGNELAERLKVEFYFPSPDHPEDDCPRWKDRRKGYPCRRCGILLLQDSSCPWRGCCFPCYLAEQREQRELRWTPEQRAGPRCRICGNPASGELDNMPACAECLNSYVVYVCEKCHGKCRVSKKDHHISLCLRCDLWERIGDRLTDEHKEAIRSIAKSGNQLEAIKRAREILGISLRDADFLVHELGG